MEDHLNRGDLLSLAEIAQVTPRADLRENLSYFIIRFTYIV